MSTRTCHGVIAAVCLTAVSMNPDIASSQETSDAKPRLSADEIVVTARKREESLQDVPLSISAFSAEKLEEVGAFDNEDVALLTPNFNTNRQVGRRLDRPTIRGMSAPSSGASPNASYFVDGAFVSGSIQTLTLGPVERVEILRGPQSAQFGRATFSGAVNYVTRKPTNEFSGQVKSSAGSHDSATVSGWASGPIVRDSLYYFASASWDTYGGEHRNSLKDGQAPLSQAAALTAPTRGDNSRLGGTDTKDIAAKFLWTPTDSTEITFKASFTKGDDDHYVQLIQEVGELNCFLPTIGNPGTVDNSGEIWFSTSPGNYCGTLDPDGVHYFDANPFNPSNPSFNVGAYPGPEAYEPGFLFPPVPGITPGVAYTLPMEGAPREARYNLPDFYDGINFAMPPTALCLGGVTLTDCVGLPAEPGMRRDTTRLMLQWDQDLAGWTWLSRATYNNDKFQQAYDLDRTERRPILGTGLFHSVDNARWEDFSLESRVESPAEGALRGQVGVNYFEQDRTSLARRIPGPGLGQYPAKPLAQTIKNYAVFGALDYDINEKLTLASEVRYAKEDRTIDSGVTCGDPTSPFFGQSGKNESSVKALSPRFTLRYQPDDSATYYALAAKGDKPAEFVTSFYRNTSDQCVAITESKRPNGGFTVLKPEKAWTWEVGTKQNWMDRRLTANLSVFYINWKNQAVAQVVNIGAVPTQINVNSGKSKVWGAELETAFLFTENLSGQFSYGLANGTFREYNDIMIAQNTGVGLGTDPTTGTAFDPNGDIVYDESANNAAGNRVPGSPKHSFIFGLAYANEVSLNLLEGPEVLEWFARTDFVLETERYASATNYTKFPNRKRWNGRLGLESTDWTITAYVNNILDDLTPTGIFGFPLVTGPTWANNINPTQNSLSPAFGRAYGIEFVYRFGD